MVGAVGGGWGRLGRLGGGLLLAWKSKCCYPRPGLLLVLCCCPLPPDVGTSYL